MAEEKRAKEVSVAARLGSKENEKLEQVMDAMEALTGERNASAALRYIVANFVFETSSLGKKAGLPADEEEDAALGRHASEIYAAVQNGKEGTVTLAEVEAELIAAGVLDG